MALNSIPADKPTIATELYPWPLRASMVEMVTDVQVRGVKYFYHFKFRLIFCVKMYTLHLALEAPMNN